MKLAAFRNHIVHSWFDRMPPVTLHVLFTYCIFYRKYATATQEKFAFVISCRPSPIAAVGGGVPAWCRAVQ
jgi:hypothetical protein